MRPCRRGDLDDLLVRIENHIREHRRGKQFGDQRMDLFKRDLKRSSFNAEEPRASVTL